MPRSRSPERREKEATRASRAHGRDHDSRRSRSPHGNHSQHRHKRRRTRSPPAKAVALPYNAKKLSRRHFDDYRPLFQSYLDIQKQLQLDDLDEREAKGRWKGFISRWYGVPPMKIQIYADSPGIVETSLAAGMTHPC